MVFLALLPKIMTRQFILGIDTSNYTTSIAVVDNIGNIVVDLRRMLNVKQGDRGLRQSDALFQHVKNIPEMIAELRGTFKYNFSAIAYSSKPRPLENSYMPVFLAGESFGKALAYSDEIPIYAFSHQEGHIEAVKAFSSFKSEDKVLACHFSGGTSELLLTEETASGFKIKIIGGSKDISYGQVIDRAGVLMGYPFPSGKYLDEMVLNSKSFSAKLTSIKAKDGWVNLSGIDTQFKNSYNQNINCDEITTELFIKLAESIVKVIKQGVEKTNIDKVIMAGGVSSSRYIKTIITSKLLKENIYLSFSDNGLSGDNAVGTALLGGKKLWQQNR